MKIVLTVKNTPQVMKPSTNNVIVYDGKQWYVTTKDDLLKEAYSLVDEAKRELAKIKADNEAYKREVAGQLLEMSELIKKLYSK